MTIATSTARADYAGDNVSTVFAVPFYFLDGTHLEVVKRDAAGAETVLVKDVHYTVAGAAVPSGGSVTTLVAPATAEQLTIRRKVPVTQTLDYVANDPFPAESHERGLDKAAMIAQQHAEELSRSLRVPVSDGAPAILPSAASRIGRLLGFGPTGDPVVSNLLLAEVEQLVANAYGPSLAQVGGNVSFLQSGTGANAYSVQRKLEDILTPLDYGGIGNGAANDTAAVQRARAEAEARAAATGSPVIIALGGRAFAVDATINMTTNLWMGGGMLAYAGTAEDAAILNFGDAAGGNLVRPAGAAANLTVKALSAAQGLVGIRLDSLVRELSILGTAEMNEDTSGTNSTGSRGQIGVEMTASRIADVSPLGTGCYQNLVDVTVRNALRPLVMRTRGDASEQLSDPQCNANVVRVRAYSCVNGILVEEGAIENEIWLRADTFISQIGLSPSRRIDVVDLRGNGNTVHFSEEIGSRAATQYSVRLGPSIVYSRVNGSTQQIVTGFLDDSDVAIGKRVKNTVRQTGSGLLVSRGGEAQDFSAYAVVAAGQTQLSIHEWSVPAKCVVTSYGTKLAGAAPSGGSTYVWFAKNADFTTSNRVEFTEGGSGDRQGVVVDQIAANDIPDRWCLEAGDTIVIAVTTPGGGGATVTAGFSVMYV